MRVVAGRLGGRRLRAPRGRDTRPTSDRVREALFAMLGPIDGVRVLDLFAGSGALAIEALSRGAAGAVIVERDGRAVEVIRANLEALGLGEDEARAITSRCPLVIGSYEPGQTAMRGSGAMLVDADQGVAVATLAGDRQIEIERRAAVALGHDAGRGRQQGGQGL